MANIGGETCQELKAERVERSAIWTLTLPKIVHSNGGDSHRETGAKIFTTERMQIKPPETTITKCGRGKILPNELQNWVL